MSTDHITRKGEAGQPTPNRAHFAAKQQSEATVSLSTPAKPFVFDKNYDNYEQVRPYFTDYENLRVELEDAGKYPYDASFKGKLPSLAGTTDKDETTAIYMLQQMYSRDQMDREVRSFTAFGGRDVEKIVGEQRGDLATYGFYVGGTGWSVIKDARVKRENGRTLVKEPRQKNWRELGSGKALFKPVGKQPLT
ncbi:hypothetical protein ACWGJ9_10205 [Curtobacterium citreum]